MKRKQVTADFVELHILHHASEDPVYGLWMIEELATHGYRLAPSRLYPKFRKLERADLLRRREHVVEGRRRKYYAITPRGRRHLVQQRRRLAELIGEVLGPADLRCALATRLTSDRARRAKSKKSKKAKKSQEEDKKTTR